MMPIQDSYSVLANKLMQRDAAVCVLGLGYVGLPLALTFWNAGLKVLGFDIDERKIKQLRNSESYIGHIKPETISRMISSGRFEPIDSPSRLSEPDVLIICVPTPLTADKDPDLTFVEATCNLIATQLRPGQLVILESTTYPGTTRGIALPILERSGLKVSHDFFLAYSPEREDPGNPVFNTATIPKVVGGIDNQSLRLADSLYSQAVVKTVPVANCEIAEACKMLENTYRAVNIALVNELKVLFAHLDIDIWEVIESAKSKPFGFHAFYPGPGLGGHCIPVDPFYLSWLARQVGASAQFIGLAGEVNASMPRYVVETLAVSLTERFEKSLNEAKIGILGVAYKRDVDDTRESPAFAIISQLEARGAIVSYCDPYVPQLPKSRQHNLTMRSSDLTKTWLESLDALVIVTDHSSINYSLIVDHAKLVIDTRNALRQRGLKTQNCVRA